MLVWLSVPQSVLVLFFGEKDHVKLDRRRVLLSFIRDGGDANQFGSRCQKASRVHRTLAQTKRERQSASLPRVGNVRQRDFVDSLPIAFEIPSAGVVFGESWGGRWRGDRERHLRVTPRLPLMATFVRRLHCTRDRDGGGDFHSERLLVAAHDRFESTLVDDDLLRATVPEELDESHECVAQDSVVVVVHRNVAGLVRVKPVQDVRNTGERNFAAKALVELVLWRAGLWW
mmetsp:Transcript_19200/g.61480  ORF Transcript_19200/g.61480 Transcript_19200/m.61480 type:complete len:230 (-) Transcript_19200:795-1484(-)